MGGEDERVRLIGIDTPETAKPDAPAECYADEARAHLGELLPDGTAIRLERDVEDRDRYGRLLAYVHRVDDDLFVNLEMATGGFATAFSVPPNVTHAPDFVAAASAARAEGRGLWDRCENDGS
jgi:micrococcal nuclease